MDEQLKQVLELFFQPAFLVQDETVIWRNRAAAPLLAEGAPLYTLLECEDTLYSLWNHTGTLNISLLLDGYGYDATVQSIGHAELFVAAKQSENMHTGANALLNASASLRKPLHTLVNAADTLFEQLPETNCDAAKQLNQTVYRFVRLCAQMADGAQFLLHRKTAVKTSVDLDKLLQDFVIQASPLVESVDIHLLYEPSPLPIKTSADPALLERALYNLVANAIGYTAKGGSIKISLKRQQQTVFITITDTGEGISPEVASSLFDRFSEHYTGDSRWGLGLGLPIVREIARLHGGSLIVGNNPSGIGTTVTFSLSLERCPQNLRSRMVHYDYCGDFHHGLVELSDVLKAKMYDPHEV